MGQRQVTTLYDQTSAAAGSLDTGIFPSEQFDQLAIYFIASGAAAPSNAGITIYYKNTQGTLVSISSSLAVPSAGGGSAIFMGQGASNQIGSVGTYSPGSQGSSPGPVPQYMKALCTAGAASTCRIVVLGIKNQ